MWAFSLSFCATIFTLIESVGRLCTDLPERDLRYVDRLLPLFCDGSSADLDQRLNLGLEADGIRAQGLVPDLRKQKWIVARPFPARRTCPSRRQQARIFSIERSIFQIEMNFRAWRKGFRIKEIPITFADRHAGTSKMSKAIVREAVGMVWKLKARAISGEL